MDIFSLRRCILQLGEGPKILARSGEKSILSGGLDGQSDLPVLSWVKNRKNSKKINKFLEIMQLHVYRKSITIFFSVFLLCFSSPAAVRERVAQQSTCRRNAGRLAGLLRLRARSPAWSTNTGHTAEK